MSNIGDKIRYNIKDYLTDREVKKLMDLFNKIKLDLSAPGFPTRTNRLEAVENMKKVLEIHNYEISEYDPDKAEPIVVADARDQHLIRQNLNKATGGR